MLKNTGALDDFTPPLEQEDAAGRALNDEQTATDARPVSLLDKAEPQYRRSLFRR